LKMKHPTYFAIATALTCIGMTGIAAGATVNDRSFLATISPSLTTTSAPVPYRVSVTNDIKSGPSHFMQQIVITVPREFTLVNVTGTQSPVTLPPLWTVASITGSANTAHVITFTTTSASMTGGKSTTFTINASAVVTSTCTKPITWSVSANQAINGGVGNSYSLRAGALYPAVNVCPPSLGAETRLTLSGTPSAISTTDTAASVTLTATLISITTGAAIQGEPITFTGGGEPVSCLSGSIVTNNAGVATCVYFPQASPNTPFLSGNVDFFAHFTGDTTPTPPWGGSDSQAWQLAVNATGTGVSVLNASGPYGGTVDLQATLASGGAGIAGKTITFFLNSVSVGTAVTGNDGVANLTNVSVAGVSAAVHSGYIGVSFAGDGTYGAATGSSDLTVIAVSGNISLSNLSQTYTGGSLSPTVTTVAASYNLTGAPQINVGTYSVTATITDPNYTGSATGSFVVGPKSVTAIVTAANKVYDGGIGATITGCSLTGVVPGDVVTCTAGSGAFASANVGSWTVTAGGLSLAGASASNYTLSSLAPTTTASITARPATVTADGKNRTYNTANPILTATVDGAVGADVLNYSLATTAAANSNVGQYPITVTLGTNPNYVVTATNGTLTVIQAHVEVTLTNMSQIYTGSTLSPTVTSSVAYSLSGAPQTDVGSYPVTATVTDPNYLGSASGNFVITKASQSITFTTMIVSATATSGGTVAFSTDTPGFCTVNPALDGNNNPVPGQAKVTLTAGNWNQCNVRADQAGNGNYGSASQATAVLTTTP
jgi:hypothetical protein